MTPLSVWPSIGLMAPSGSHLNLQVEDFKVAVTVQEVYSDISVIRKDQNLLIQGQSGMMKMQQQILVSLFSALPFIDSWQFLRQIGGRPNSPPRIMRLMWRVKFRSWRRIFLSLLGKNVVIFC